MANESHPIEEAVSQVVFEVLQQFLERHREVVDEGQVKVATMVISEFFGSVLDLDVSVEQNVEVDDLTARRYADNAAGFNEDVLVLQEGGSKFLQGAYPNLWALTEEGEPLLEKAMREVIDNTLYHLFGVRRVKLGEPLDGWVIVVEAGADWSIEGLNPPRSVRSVSPEFVEALKRE